jgi:hypothetical protein
VGSGTTATPYDLADTARSLGHEVDLKDHAAGAPVVRFDCDAAPAIAMLGLAPARLADGIADELRWRMAVGGGR